MSDILRQKAFEAIKGFAWWNYGLDGVDQAESDEWAHALADEVAAAITDAVKYSAAVTPNGPGDLR